jgi:putative membrane protein
MENNLMELKDGYGLVPALNRNDRTARIFIWIVSVIVFLAVALLSSVKLNIDIGFNPHLFAKANAIINSIVVVLLLSALVAVKQKKYLLHKRLMMAAIIFSILFLLSYICHHLLGGETKFGDLDHNGIVSTDEKNVAGSLRIVYYFILGTHIPLAGIILPFILFTAYRSLTGEYIRHKKIARITFPVWLYVAVTGVIVYILISPYYTWHIS